VSTVNEEATKMARKMARKTTTTAPWAEVLTLGDTRFGVLAGGPFDGRCYPLPDGMTPLILDVPGPAPGPALRYVLRDGLYRYQHAERSAA
jgi:hypothetical protein